MCGTGREAIAGRWKLGCDTPICGAGREGAAKCGFGRAAMAGRCGAG
jgi:hypothetical protein